MKRRETPESARLNAKQYALAFRDRPDSLARTEVFLRRMIVRYEELTEHSNARARIEAASSYANRGSKWSATYYARKDQRTLANYRAQLEGHLEGAATPKPGILPEGMAGHGSHRPGMICLECERTGVRP